MKGSGSFMTTNLQYSAPMALDTTTNIFLHVACFIPKATILCHAGMNYHPSYLTSFTTQTRRETFNTGWILELQIGFGAECTGGNFSSMHSAKLHDFIRSRYYGCHMVQYNNQCSIVTISIHIKGANKVLVDQLCWDYWLVNLQIFLHHSSRVRLYALSDTKQDAAVLYIVIMFYNLILYISTHSITFCFEQRMTILWRGSWWSVLVYITTDFPWREPS